MALAVVAPFVAAVLAPLVQKFAKPFAGWLLALVPAGIFWFFLSLIAPVLADGAVSARISWVPAYDLDLSFYIDGLSLTFALAISGIGALVTLYAGAYLKSHAHLGRFYAFLLAFMGAMLGLVLADNMLALFIFWELTSVTSFLLIGFDHQRMAARRAAIQALVVTNIGGLALLVGVILLHQATGTWDLSAVGDTVRGTPLCGSMLAAFLLSACTKSAQVPFHLWLPNAMEAPTPVSAFLHSATMVQAGVYLLARISPFMGGTQAWTIALVTIGSVTLLWGALAALKQTDLKQMLAQTTVASLGLSVILLGLGSSLAISAFLLYFVGHALYKASLFMVVGAVDHGTGTRDVTLLGGLSDKMPVSFIAAAVASLAMIGLPLSLGYFAKEEMYLALTTGSWTELLVLAVLVAGNALLAGVALVVMIKPFLGPERVTPRVAHEAPIAMLIGPLALGAVGIVASLSPDWLNATLVAPGTQAVLGETVAGHLAWAVNPANPAIWLSLATWVLALLVYRQAATLRTLLRRVELASADRIFDGMMFGLIRFAGAVTRLLHHGRLEIYLVTVFAGLALALIVPVALWGGYQLLMPNAELGNWSVHLAWPNLQVHEWGVVLLALVGLVAVLAAKSRLIAILALGIQGAALALLFLLFGAPDLGFTQFMVELLSVVILALVMTRLRLDERDHRELEDLARDGTLALTCGVGVSLLLMVVLRGDFDARLSDVFAATSVPIAHGANIVNVILVDYRGFDTLGEISVVMGAGLAIMALLRRRAATPVDVRAPAKRRRRATA